MEVPLTFLILTVCLTMCLVHDYHRGDYAYATVGFFASLAFGCGYKWFVMPLNIQRVII